jgi:hypothetical protein
MTKRLEQNHLEESIEDNGAIVKGAFEKYVDTNFRDALNFWQRSESREDNVLALPKEVSLRLLKLVNSNLLADKKKGRLKI